MFLAAKRAFDGLLLKLAGENRAILSIVGARKPRDPLQIIHAEEIACSHK
jgi:hypothetical protein